MKKNSFYIVFIVLLSLTDGNLQQNKKKLNEEKRIRGGRDVDISQVKYYVLVLCGSTMCGGTLVRRNKVLTAGHCVDSCQTRELQAVTGLGSISQYFQAKKYSAKEINIHPKYDKNDPFPYDAAVVTLSQDVELNANVGTIPYATNTPPVGKSLTVVGYGFINTDGQRPQRLQRAQERIVGYQTTRILTDATGPSVLPGDSGGPAVYANQLAGITSGYISNNGRIIANIFVAVGNPEILSFIRKYAP